MKGIGWYIEEYGIAQLSLNLTDIKHDLRIAFDEACAKAQARGIRVPDRNWWGCCHCA